MFTYLLKDNQNKHKRQRDKSTCSCVHPHSLQPKDSGDPSSGRNDDTRRSGVLLVVSSEHIFYSMLDYLVSHREHDDLAPPRHQ